MNNNIQSFLITNAEVQTDVLVLTLNGTPNLMDTARVVLRFAPNVAIPSGSANLPVEIVVNGTNTPLLNRYGDNMLGGELKATTSGTYFCPRFNYLTYVGLVDTDYHFITHNFPLRTCSYYIF